MKKKKMTSVPGGLGPYFCSIFFNTSSKCKKQTHPVAHTYPHLIGDRMNSQIIRGNQERKREREEDEECWVQILKIGPFNSWNECRKFLSTWIFRTRGKKRRLERGVELARQYEKHILVQKIPRDEAVENFYKNIEAIHFDKEEAPPAPKRQTLTIDVIGQIFAHGGEAIPIKTVKEIHAKLKK